MDKVYDVIYKRIKQKEQMVIQTFNMAWDKGPYLNLLQITCQENIQPFQKHLAPTHNSSNFLVNSWWSIWFCGDLLIKLI